MYDFHTHSDFSNDSKSSMPSMVEGAYNHGLKGICFTDHLDIDYPGYDMNFEFDYGLYKKAINEMRNAYKDKIEIFSGIEVGLQPHIKKENTEYLSGREYDFVLGSIHVVGRKDMYDGSFYQGLTDKQCIMNYFRDLIDCIDGYNDYDVIGHLDVMRRYLKNGEGSFVFKNYKGLIQSILIKLINSNKGIEINTSGIRYKLSDFHPLREIVKLYKFLGGEIITIGSDAHKPQDIGYRFDEAKEMLLENGFKYYTIFRERKPYFVKL